jgi:4-hydroxythreonine-4-phosphate dehydrogenase
MNSELPVIGLMPGDPTGIGPEVCARLLASGEAQEAARVVVVGDARVLELGMADARVAFKWHRVDAVPTGQWPKDSVPVLDLGNLDPAHIRRGETSPECGRIVGATLKRMIELAQAGELDAICFAPLSKLALKRGGWDYLDEHVMFADLTGHRGFYCEMNVIPQFCTFRVTSHMALKRALEMISAERIEGAVRLAHATLARMGKPRPRIGVAALNPHGGEGGLFGDEEITLITPTLDRLRAAGVECEGPVPADTLFVKALAGRYDGVVMMYHDQGQIATKLIGFREGVTVTSGLPTVFATPAHGTAYDIVGQGKADPGAMTKAFLIAASLAAKRADPATLAKEGA